MSKDEILAVRVTPKKMNEIKDEAQRRDVNAAELARQAIDFYLSFDLDFLNNIKLTAKKMEVSLSICIQQLLVSYIAQDYGYIEKLGKPSPAFLRAFQYSEKGIDKESKKGLIIGNEHSELVKNQTESDVEELLKSLKKTAKTGIPSRINREQAIILHAGMKRASL